jgi:hypothetical protein
VCELDDVVLLLQMVEEGFGIAVIAGSPVLQTPGEVCPDTSHTLGMAVHCRVSRR